MKKISACPGWLGLSKDRRSFVHLEDRAETVQKIFELCIGGLGSYAIANHLDRQKIPTFPPSLKWDHTTIDSMLRNRATVGEFQPKSYAQGDKKGKPIGDPVPNYYPAVITETVFKAAQAARRSNLAIGRGRKGENFTNLFGGLTTCEYCGSKVKFQAKGDRKSLICQKVLDDQGCNRTAWSYGNFERSVLHFVCHPALRETVDARKRVELEKIAESVALMAEDAYAARFSIGSSLKKILSNLTLANGGPDPVPSALGAIIRRDNPKRFFHIRLWDGPVYKGCPI